MNENKEVSKKHHFDETSGKKRKNQEFRSLKNRKRTKKFADDGGGKNQRNFDENSASEQQGGKRRRENPVPQTVSNKKGRKPRPVPSNSRKSRFIKIFNERCSIEEFGKLYEDYLQNLSLTAVERDQYTLKADEFISAAHNDESVDVNDFLQTNIPDWNEKFRDNPNSASENGSPYIIVICGSAVRAVNLNRQISRFKTDKARVAKLFGKHMKPAEQKNFLSNHVTHLAIGTPQRVLDLLTTGGKEDEKDEKSSSSSDGALKSRNLRHVIIDWSFADVKKRRLADYSYIRDRLFDLIRMHLMSMIESGRLKALLI